MSYPARTSPIYDLHNAPTRDSRDVVVMKAITNVTDRQPLEGWWEASPDGRDRSFTTRSGDLIKYGRAECLTHGEGCGQPSLSDSMPAYAAHNSPCLVDVVAISIPLAKRLTKACALLIATTEAGPHESNRQITRAVILFEEGNP
jgi:hypothetical protein